MRGEKRFSVVEANSHAAVKRSFTRVERAIFSALFVFYFVIANAISLARTEHTEEWLLPLVRRYSGFFGLEQNWSMFAPNPRNMNLHTICVITFQDGSEKLYEYPRMELLTEWEHFRHEKLRKLFNEYMAEPLGKKARPSLARHLAWCNDNADNCPEMITYIFNYVDMPKPDPHNWIRVADLPPHYNKSPYFVFRISPGDLLRSNR